MTIVAPTLDTITGHTVMVKMRELIKQMTVFAKEVADLVNTIPTDVQDTYSREAIDNMLAEIEGSIDDVSDAIALKQDILTAGSNITIENNIISASASSSGNFSLIASGELQNSSNYIYLNQDTDGLYVVNIPDYGGHYIILCINGMTFMSSSIKDATVHFAGVEYSVYRLLKIGATFTGTHQIAFRLYNLDLTYIATNPTWTDSNMVNGTSYEIYFLPISE